MFSKEFFPYLANNPELAYFDSASTTHIHQVVLDAMNDYYVTCGATPGRGNYPAGDIAEILVEKATKKVANLIGTTPEHILFTTGATQGLNWIANWYSHIEIVVVCENDHHSTVMPFIAQGRSVEDGTLKVLPVGIDGLVNAQEADDLFKSLMTQGKQALFVTNITSNITGEEQPIDIFTTANFYGHITVMDASQIIANARINIDYDDVNYIVFSGHKMYGPKGIGVLYSKIPVSDLEPIYYGGGTVSELTFNGYTHYNDNRKHIAGTPNTPAIIGMGKVADIIQYTDYTELAGQNHMIVNCLDKLGLFDLSELIHVGSMQSHLGGAHFKSIMSFVPENFNSADLSELLYSKGVAIRTGNMCAHPFATRLTDQGVIRVSIAPYNTEEDCKKLVHELKQAIFKLT